MWFSIYSVYDPFDAMHSCVFVSRIMVIDKINICLIKVYVTFVCSALVRKAIFSFVVGATRVNTFELMVAINIPSYNGKLIHYFPFLEPA
jgi:hypothetical protein